MKDALMAVLFFGGVIGMVVGFVAWDAFWFRAGLAAFGVSGLIYYFTDHQARRISSNGDGSRSG